MMRTDTPIMFAAIPAQFARCAASVSARSTAVSRSAAVAGRLGWDRNASERIRGLIM